MSDEQPQRWPAEQVVPLLEKVSLFEGLDDADLERIAGLVRGVSIEEGELVFEEGEPGDAFYIVFDGAVEIFKESPTGGEEKLAVRRAGEAFGEMALLNDAPRSAGARASKKTQLMMVERDDFMGLIEQDTLAGRMMQALAKALRALNVRFAARERSGAAASAVAADPSVLVQQGLLPRNVPSVEGYDLAAGTSLPDTSRGETIWDWFDVAGGGVCLTTLHVRGEGLPPSLHFAQARALMRELGRDLGKVEELLPRVNHALTEVSIEGVDQFVECGLLVIRDGALRWGSAGPVAAGIVRRDGGLEKLSSHGPALGMMAGFSYHGSSVELQSGDSLLVLSEGSSGLLEGAADLVAGRRGKPAGEIVGALHRAIDKAQGGDAIDVSVVFVRKQ